MYAEYTEPAIHRSYCYFITIRWHVNDKKHPESGVYNIIYNKLLASMSERINKIKPKRIRRISKKQKTKLTVCRLRNILTQNPYYYLYSIRRHSIRSKTPIHYTPWKHSLDAAVCHFWYAQNVRTDWLEHRWLLQNSCAAPTIAIGLMDQIFHSYPFLYFYATYYSWYICYVTPPFDSIICSWNA